MAILKAVHSGDIKTLSKLANAPGTGEAFSEVLAKVEPTWNAGSIKSALQDTASGKYSLQQALEGETVSVSARKVLSALTSGASSAAAEHMTSLGIATPGSTGYAGLTRAWSEDAQQLAKQGQDGRGATQPLAPLERVNDLMTMLSDLNNHQSTSNVNPDVYSAMLSRAGVPGGSSAQDQAVTGYPGVSSDHLENIVRGAIQTHLTDMGADKADVDAAVSAQQLKAVPVPSAALSGYQAEGFKLPGVTTFGSLIPAVHQQSISTPQGQGAPGGTVTTTTPAVTSQSGAQLYAGFQSQWKANKDNFQNRATAALNEAGISSSQLTTADYGAVAQAFVSAMGNTPAGGSVWQTVQTATKTLQGGKIYTNPAYAQVMSEADKIGTHLTNDEANHLAALYGGSSSTGDVDALNTAIASYYQFDPNEVPKPGSYAATAQQAIEDEYGKYGITLTNDQSGSMVQDLLKQGGTDLSSLYTAQDAGSAYAELRAKTAASALYPTLAPFISQGQTLTGSGGLLAPYQSAYANMMGVNSSSVNTSDPDFIKLVAQDTGTTQGAKGTQAAGSAVGQPAGQSTDASGGLKSVDQFQAAVMQSPKGLAGGPAWQNTENAQDAYSGMANYLLGSMGFSPTAADQSPSPSSNVQQGLS
jgi:hypothetical protein